MLHRLDMNTSGVVLFAKTRDVVPGLHAQFRWAGRARGSVAGVRVGGAVAWGACHSLERVLRVNGLIGWAAGTSSC